jgi:hypothetical protein
MYKLEFTPQLFQTLDQILVTSIHCTVPYNRVSELITSVAMQVKAQQEEQKKDTKE